MKITEWTNEIPPDPIETFYLRIEKWYKDNKHHGVKILPADDPYKRVGFVLYYETPLGKEVAVHYTLAWEHFGGMDWGGKLIALRKRIELLGNS